MTVRELMKEIRALTEEINKRRLEYKEELEEGEEFNNVYERRFAKLQESGARIKYYEGVDEFMLKENLYGRIRDEKTGKKRFKRKADYEEQMERMQSFLDADVYTPTGTKSFDERGHRSYEGFKAKYKLGSEFTEEDWSNMYDQFNMIKKHAESYGYEDKEASKAYVKAYLSADEMQRETFGSIVEEAYLDLKLKGKAITYKDVLRRVKIKLRKKK